MREKKKCFYEIYLAETLPKSSWHAIPSSGSSISSPRESRKDCIPRCLARLCTLTLLRSCWRNTDERSVRLLINALQPRQVLASGECWLAVSAGQDQDQCLVSDQCDAATDDQVVLVCGWVREVEQKHRELGVGDRVLGFRKTRRRGQNNLKLVNCSSGSFTQDNILVGLQPLFILSGGNGCTSPRLD